jgi:hypothetical protein
MKAFLVLRVSLTTENKEVTESLCTLCVLWVRLFLPCLRRATTHKTVAGKSSTQFRCGKQP